MFIQDNLAFNTSDLGTTFVTIGGTSRSTGRIIGFTITTFAGETAFNINSGIGASSFVRILDCNISAGVTGGAGTVFDAGGINKSDPRVFASDCDGIVDSVHFGGFTVMGNTTTTSPGVIGNYVDFDFDDPGIVIDSDISERIVVIDVKNGEQINNGLKDITVVLGFEAIGTSSQNNKQLNVKYVVDKDTGTFVDIDGFPPRLSEFTNRLRSAPSFGGFLLRPKWKIKPQLANAETDNVTYDFVSATQEVHKVG